MMASHKLARPARWASSASTRSYSVASPVVLYPKPRPLPATYQEQLVPWVKMAPHSKSHSSHNFQRSFKSRDRHIDAVVRCAGEFKRMAKESTVINKLRTLGFFKAPAWRIPVHTAAIVRENIIKSLASRFSLQVNRKYRPPSKPARLNPDSLPLAQDDASINNWLIANFIPWAVTESVPKSFSTKPARSPHSIAYHTLQHLGKLTDMRRPQDLFPAARRHKRKIHLHVGPTNSGKTYAALKALQQAHHGAYAGPLRLLAHEVFSRINEGRLAPDIPPRACNLITGEEQRIVDPNASLLSCTVEMLSPNTVFDVCVIDEIQMIGNQPRGSAWTDAVLGVQALNLHLCGEESVIGLIRQIAEDCGDDFIVHRYERLSPLVVASNSLQGDLKKIRRGDCVVAFSRTSIYNFKHAIEQETGLRVGLAYGGLPPEVREREARLFNEGSSIPGAAGYDVLVGSDAIGMGLNLKIRRVIFESVHKYNGRVNIPLSISQVKQIGGRAGRFSTTNSASTISESTSQQNITAGEVLTLHEADMAKLGKAMSAKTIPIEKAVFRSPAKTLSGFANLVPPKTAFSSLLKLRSEVTLTSLNYEIADESDAMKVADVIKDVTSLSRAHRDLMCSAPCSTRDPMVVASLQNWAQKHANGEQAKLSDWIESEGIEAAISDVTNPTPLPDRTPKPEEEVTTKTLKQVRHREGIDRSVQSAALFKLESTHRCLVLYLWLACRLPHTFSQSSICTELKTRLELVMQDSIAKIQSAGQPSVLQQRPISEIERSKSSSQEDNYIKQSRKVFRATKFARPKKAAFPSASSN